jgi:hypothetical protein
MLSNIRIFTIEIIVGDLATHIINYPSVDLNVDFEEELPFGQLWCSATTQRELILIEAHEEIEDWGIKLVWINHKKLFRRIEIMSIYALPDEVFNECVLLGIKKFKITFEKKYGYLPRRHRLDGSILNIGFSYECGEVLKKDIYFSLKKKIADRFLLKEEIFDESITSLEIEFDFIADLITIRTKFRSFEIDLRMMQLCNTI